MKGIVKLGQGSDKVKADILGPKVLNFWAKFSVSMTQRYTNSKLSRYVEKNK